MFSVLTIELQPGDFTVSEGVVAVNVCVAVVGANTADFTVPVTLRTISTTAIGTIYSNLTYQLDSL